MTAGGGEGLTVTKRVEAKSLAELGSTKENGDGSGAEGGNNGEGQKTKSW